MESTAPSANAPLILVADDVAANVELLFDQLHVLGFRAIAASDGPSTLAACFEHRPDLCILDVSMPAGDLGVDDGVERRPAFGRRTNERTRTHLINPAGIRPAMHPG